MAGSPPDIDALDVEGLKSLLVRVLEDNAALRAEVAALREENRRLKGLKGPPSLKPSGMDRETQPGPKRGSGARRRGAKNARLAIDGSLIATADVRQPLTQPAVSDVHENVGFRGYCALESA